MKKFNIFLHNICRDVQHSLVRSRYCENDFSNTNVLKIPSKLLLGIDMFTLTFVDLENETRISV